MRKDAVSPELALAVLRRDNGCVAPRLGGSMHDCWGRNGIEHVKAEPRMGKRAEARMDRLVTLCDGHREPGMKAGRVWCTDKANREAMREYLRTVGNPHDAHVDPCGPTCRDAVSSCSDRDALEVARLMALLAPDMAAHPEEYTPEALARRSLFLVDAE